MTRLKCMPLFTDNLISAIAFKSHLCLRIFKYSAPRYFTRFDINDTKWQMALMGIITSCNEANLNVQKRGKKELTTVVDGKIFSK